MRAAFLLVILTLFGCGSDEHSGGEFSTEELDKFRGLLPKIDRMLSREGNKEMVALRLDADFLDRVLAARAEQERTAAVTERAVADQDLGLDVMERRLQIAKRHGFAGHQDLLVAELRVQRAYYYGGLEQHGNLPPAALRDEIDLVRSREDEVRRVLRLGR